MIPLLKNVNEGIIVRGPDPQKANLTYSAEYCHNFGMPDGLWLEMGTATGGTAKIISKCLPPNNILYTFDCFTGLPETWADLGGQGFKPGSFAQEERPDLDSRPALRIKIVEGLFEDSLPPFLEKHEGAVSFLHVDCDLYSSTKTIFKYLKDRIVPGTVIVFDEIHNAGTLERPDLPEEIQRLVAAERYTAPPHGGLLSEGRAFGEFAKQNNVEYRFFSCTRGNQASCLITNINKGNKLK